ncbi:MAG: peptidase M22 [Clostridiales bacterium]|nr:peptidase M22 [Clostridiales bacterium]HOA85140.1 peptidase M22 [Bacillota bacterium]
MSRKCYVGFDTSNYTTSAALCDEDGRVIASIKQPLPVRGGEAGLRQSDALFSHIKNLPPVADRLREALAGYTPAAVGCSARPRSVEGSYMPCFLAGSAAAHAFAAAAGVPVLYFSHQDGHIMAAAYSSGEPERFRKDPFCAFHVSGGTTEILHVTPRAGGYDIKLLGGTKDLNAGQAIDRAGVMMELSFPCGPALEELAAANTEKIPAPRVSVHGLECNLSGLENLAAGLYSASQNKNLTAAYVINFISVTLCELTSNLRAEYPGLPVLYAGGVMSNSIIKSALSRFDNVYFATPEFSADNAAGIALLCRRAVADGEGDTHV